MLGLFKTALLSLLLPFLPFAVSANEDAPAGETLAWDLESRPALTLLLPGMSHHFDAPEDSARRWNETHAGLGLAWRSKWDETGWYLKTAIGTMHDSVESWGAYGGVAWQYRMFDGASWLVDAGGGIFLFYRAVQFDGPHIWLPGALPVLSAEHRPTGLGLNVLYVPNVKFDAGEMPSVIYVQLTKQL